jgi:hypothetical protein
MKKLQIYFILFISAAIFFSSCETSLIKRHYRKGYDFDFTKKQKALTSESKFAKVESDLPVYASAQPSGKEYLKPHSLSPLTNEVEINEFYSPTTDSKSEIKNSATHKTHEHTQIKKSNTLPPNKKVTKFQELKNFSNLKKIISRHDDDVDVHYHGGLIWTIISVLLVLWLLSLLTGGWGLGGLIYIFLVVALVLILLRLLRIIL